MAGGCAGPGEQVAGGAEVLKKAVELTNIKTIFLDTAPIIYFIEGHPRFGEAVAGIVALFQSGRCAAYSSTVTLTEVLPVPVKLRKKDLAKKFVDFLLHGINFNMLPISAEIAIRAGNLRGKYEALRSIDAIQIAAAMEVRADVFLTNDKRLQQVKELAVWTVDDLAGLRLPRL